MWKQPLLSWSLFVFRVFYADKNDPATPPTKPLTILPTTGTEMRACPMAAPAVLPATLNQLVVNLLPTASLNSVWLILSACNLKVRPFTPQGKVFTVVGKRVKFFLPQPTSRSQNNSFGIETLSVYRSVHSMNLECVLVPNHLCDGDDAKKSGFTIVIVIFNDLEFTPLCIDIFYYSMMPESTPEPREGDVISSFKLVDRVHTYLRLTFILLTMTVGH